MRKVVVVAIRYSVLFGKNTKGFHLSATQDSHEKYKNELFSNSRMSLREWLFGNFTLPSLKEVFENKGDDVEFKVLLMTSTELPEKNKAYIERVANENSEWFFLSYVDPSRVKYGEHISPLLNKYKEEGDFICATARLDDDDALFKDYAKELGSIMSEETDGSVVSFSLGYNIYTTSDKEFVGASEYHHSKNSAGLAYIRKYADPEMVQLDNIYTCGNHIKISENFNVIEYECKHSFLRVNTEYSDRMYKISESDRKKRVFLEFNKQDKKVDLGAMSSSFPAVFK